MAARTTVLDDLDDATARIILKSHLKDIKDLGPSVPAGSNEQLAHNLYRNELKAYQLLRGFSDAEEEDTDDPANDGRNKRARSPGAGDGRDEKNKRTKTDARDERPQFQCTACGDHNISDHDYPAPCGHHYCTGCVTSVFITSIRDERFYPPRCCTQPMPFEDARVFLRPEVEAEFEGEKQELDDPHRTYCHVPTCSTYIPPDHKHGDLARCPGCNETTCVVCQGADHHGDCPQDEGIQVVVEAGRQKGWQRCYACRRMIELTIGCNHITCICRAEFCYVCGVAWKLCNCAVWDEERLLERAQQVAERERANPVQVAVQLRQRHECPVGQHVFAREPGSATCDYCDEWLPHFHYQCWECHETRCNRCRYNA